MKSEEEEIDELQALFSEGVQRESALPVALYAKLEVFEDNRRKAEKLRKEREQRALEIQQAAELRNQRAAALREKVKAEGGKAIEAHKGGNLEQGRAQRQLEAKWEEERNEEKRQYVEKGRKNVLIAKGLDGKLDALEEEAARRRKDGYEQRQMLDAAVKEKEVQTTLEKNALAKHVRHEVEAGNAYADASLKAMKGGKASQTRAAKGEWKSEKQRLEAEYLAEAAAKKAKALASREAAKRVKKDMLEARTASATIERDNDYLVEEEKAKILARNKAMRAERYRQRFATQAEADEFEASQLNVLYKYQGASSPSSPMELETTPAGEEGM